MLSDFINSGPGQQREMYATALARIKELESPPEDLSSLTVAELRSRCQTAEIVGYGKMKKPELVKALS